MTPRSSKKKKDNNKVLCTCGCNSILSKSTAYRHRNGLAPNLKHRVGLVERLRVKTRKHQPNLEQRPDSQSIASRTSTILSQVSSTVLRVFSGGSRKSESRPEVEVHEAICLDHDIVMEGAENGDHSNRNEVSADRDKTVGIDWFDDNLGSQKKQADEVIEKLRRNTQDQERYRVTVEDYESDIEDAPSSSSDEDDWDWEDNDSDADSEGFTAEDRMNEEFEQYVFNIEEDLSDDDLEFIRLFKLKYKWHLPNGAIDDIAALYPDKNTPSFKVTRARITFLAAFQPQRYDCCINSCICYVGPKANDQSCHHCNEPRFDPISGCPRKFFTYVPLIPRLLQFHRSEKMSKEMRYRGEYEGKRSENVISDVFDGSLYRSLRDMHITVDGKELLSKFFSDDRDIALGLSTDGFAPFKRRKHTCWPLLIFNYNLPPEVRFHLAHILCVGVIPGPKKPKEFDSFQWPLIQELLELAFGIKAFDGSTKKLFVLRAFLILIFGDMPAISMVMCMKGHNGKSPCRACKIQGLRIPGSRATTHYVPLNRSLHPDTQNDNTVKEYDPLDLPLRSHKEFLEMAQDVQFARSAAEADRLAMQYGIKATPLLSYAPSIVFPTSFPHDFMHLIYENLIKNMVLLWTGAFKDLDEGTEDYRLQPAIWEAIGKATAASGKTIPLAFGARPKNVAEDKSASTADSWSFWILYIGPVLLQRKFKNEKYYNHFVELVKLINLCLQFEITRSQVDEIRRGFASWVEDFEKIYYQYSPERLSICPVTVHALLHIADGIEACGPVWTYWAFPMERFCGRLQPAIKSRRFPYTNIDNHVVATAQLDQIQLRYKLNTILPNCKAQRLAAGYDYEQSLAYAVEDYPHCELLPPRRFTAAISDFHANKIVVCLATRFKVSVANARKAFVPVRDQVEQWGKVQRTDGGDKICASSMTKVRDDSRDSTYIRYELLVDVNAARRNASEEFVASTFYGQLQHIFVVHLQPSRELGLQDSRTLFLVGIRPCKITRKHASLDIHYYKDSGTFEVVDISTVQCLIGRIPGDGETALVDRSGGMARAYYDPLDE